jgi:hypothetical protein
MDLAGLGASKIAYRSLTLHRVGAAVKGNLIDSRKTLA